jgi:3-hydroxybutyryl-CoA dehydrogenase
MDITPSEHPIIVYGNGKLACSVTVCLLSAGHRVTLVTEERDGSMEIINRHFADISRFGSGESKGYFLEVISFADCKIGQHAMGVAITGEDLSEKRSVIQRLEEKLLPGSVIAINTESIPLSLLQKDCRQPERVLGLNWVEPAHTTFFLEIIINAKTDKEHAGGLSHLAKNSWNKDPYIMSHDTGIRAKLMSGLVREAFYLVQNGYASIEDIDRACKNDAGYYLPFAGNFRYMDLMGPYAYGLVMKDLNRELSKDGQVPAFFEDIIRQDGQGMENDKGFYEYEEGEVRRWNELFSTFSYQIQAIIKKNML